MSLVADDIRQVGVGELLARIERLKVLLGQEGLFAADRKRPLPFLPGVVGLITGRASAAERDVLENARRRWPAVAFEVRNVAVQGHLAVEQCIRAVADLDGKVDVIVIARGGGSVEDLLPFSDEALLRAVSRPAAPRSSARSGTSRTTRCSTWSPTSAARPRPMPASGSCPTCARRLQRIHQLRDRAAAWSPGLQREQHRLDEARSRPVLADPHTLVTSAVQRGGLA